MNMPNQSGKVVLILILALLTLGASAYFFVPFLKKQNYQEPISPVVSDIQDPKEAPQTSGLTRDYYSKALKISFKIPKDSRTEEKFVDVKVFVKNGVIAITNVGTNYSNTKEYFADLKKKNHLIPKDYQELMINGRSSVKVKLNDPNDKSKIQITYFIYDQDGIYTFYTSDEALYPVLDEIVQSFEYKP